MNAAKKAPNYPSEVEALPEDQRLDAYQAYLAGNEHRQDSLANRISAGVSLSESDIEDLIGIIGNRCQERTKRRLRGALRMVPNIESFGIFSRVHYDAKHGWSYCAGQDYRAEMPVVKRCLIGR